MPYTLKDRRVLVTAGSRGLGALVAEKFAREGAHVAINYVEREAPARELADRLARECGVRTAVIRGDAGVIKDCERCVRETVDAFGGIDIIIGNAGWTRFAKFADLDDMQEHEWDKCYAVNVKGQMAVLRAALPHFNANPDGGAFIITSSVAGVKPTGSSMPYCVTKAAGLHLMKCLAATQGPKVRVNAVLPGLLMTEWGQKFPPERIKEMESRAALKMTTDLEDCADAFIMLAKNTSM